MMIPVAFYKCTGEELRALLRGKESQRIMDQEGLHSDLECTTQGCTNRREDWRFCWVCNERKDG